MNYQVHAAAWPEFRSAARDLCGSRFSPVRIGVVLSIALAIALGNISAARATEVVDQSNIATPTGNFFAVFGTRQFGQTFSVGIDGFLTRVEMYVDVRGTPAGDLVAEIHGVAGGLPDGNVQGSATIASGSVVDGLNSFDVTAAGVAIEIGEQYAIVLKSAGSSGGNDYLARAVPGNLYSPGQAVENPAGGWSTFGLPAQGFDAIFQTFVMPVEQALPYGAATRNILNGSAFGFPIDPVDVIRGDADIRMMTTWVFTIPAGFNFANGRLIDNGVSAGAFMASSQGSGTTANGATRGIAWRSFVNESATSETLRINAVLNGSFSGPAVGTATGFVYAFDAAMLDETLNAVAPNAADYLLAGDGLAALIAGGSGLSLAGLFPPSALLASGFETLTSGTGGQSVPINSSFTTLAPGQVFTVMFDVSVYQPPGGAANFYDTLLPDAVFFTDEAGQPVTTIAATAPVIDPEVPPASVALTPTNTSGPVGTMQTVTATVLDGSNIPIADAVVLFTITSGPNAGATGPIGTDENGVAEFSYADLSGNGGTDTIDATIDALQSNTASVEWTIPGPLDSITIDPLTITVPAGQSVSYTTEAFDQFSNTRGDVTGETAFSITDGSCNGASCSATTPGPHTVTANHNGAIVVATLTVEADSDGDGLVDSADNCTAVANAAQLDFDADGIGNICDGDFDQNCSLNNFSDLAIMEAQFFTPGQLNTDMNGDGNTNFGDLSLFSAAFFLPPGPSGIPNICDET